MEAFENRLRKNLARLAPWAKREGIGAWRVYDRDLPEAPYAVDRYGDRVLVTEYESAVGRRQSRSERAGEIEETGRAIEAVLGVSREAILRKTRTRHRSTERRARGDASHEFPVEEHGRRFLVNLVDYLDTGLFLDQRVARERLAEIAPGQRVLNLFSYTGAFSVYAATGGAREVTSVDLSGTYLAWARRNFEVNGVEPRRHPLVRADVVDFLRASDATWETIVLDAPTASRSSGGHSFDLQSAHPRLLQLALARLAPGGRLFFSTNDRRFRLAFSGAEDLSIREITRETTPPDFRHAPHRAFEVQHGRRLGGAAHGDRYR